MYTLLIKIFPLNGKHMKMKKEYLILAAVIFGLSAYLFYRSADRTHYTLPKLPALPRKLPTLPRARWKKPRSKLLSRRFGRRTTGVVGSPAAPLLFGRTWRPKRGQKLLIAKPLNPR